MGSSHFILALLLAIGLRADKFPDEGTASNFLATYQANLEQYWSDIDVSFSSVYDGMIDAKNSVLSGDGTHFNWAQARAKADLIRRKSNPDKFGGVTCTLNSENAFPGSILIADCSGTISLNIPIIGNQNIPLSATRTFVFDENTGFLTTFTVKSSGGRFGEIISSFVQGANNGKSSNAVGGDPLEPIFKFGSFEVDKFDAVILFIFGVISIFIVVAIFYIINKVNGIYRVVGGNNKSYQYAKVAQLADTETE
eukprot:12851_1